MRGVPRSQSGLLGSAVGGAGRSGTSVTVLCTAARRAKYPWRRCICEDATGVLPHPWGKLRLRRTSCPPIAVNSSDTKPF